MSDEGGKGGVDYRSVRIGIAVGAGIVLGFLLLTRNTVDPVTSGLLLVFIAGLLSVDIPGLRGGS
jgi:hypothetical protein